MEVLRGALTGMTSERSIGAEFRAGAVGRIDSCEISGVDTGVVVGDSEDMLEERCPECGLSGPAAPAAARVALQGSGGQRVAGARCIHSGAVSRVTMADVQVDARKWGVGVRRYGSLEASRVTVAGCGVGFQVEGDIVGSAFEHCKAVRCGTEVVRCVKEMLMPARWHASCAADKASAEGSPEVSDQMTRGGKPEPGQAKPFRRYKRRSTCELSASGFVADAHSGTE